MKSVAGLVMGMVLAVASAVHAEEIHVAAAISMKEALTDAAAAWKSQGGADVQFAFGSSGALAAQIRNSNTIDLFVSAAEKQMDELQKSSLIENASRRDIATNTLVLVVPKDAARLPKGFGDLLGAGVQHVAIGEPKTVPAGDYAVTLLTHLKLMDALKPKLIYGANVRQVLMFVERGEADAGLVYATDAKESNGLVQVAATADSKDLAPAQYPAAVLAGSEHAAAAQKFLDFLASESGQKVLASHGFLPAPAQKPASVP